jgi:hypothetical protein
MKLFNRRGWMDELKGRRGLATLDKKKFKMDFSNMTEIGILVGEIIQVQN